MPLTGFFRLTWTIQLGVGITFHTDLETLTKVQDELRARVVEREDDLRLYAIPNPAALWAAGKQAQRLTGLYGGDAETTGARPGRLHRWFKGLFAQEAA